MKRVIHKQHFALNDRQAFQAHREITPLTVQRQGKNWSLWYETWADDPNAQRRQCYWRIHVIGTGHPFDPEGLDWIATQQDGEFVWHFYIERVS